ncbi:MAG: tRNA lysidine(34) synthetase TilS [Persicimonas sp.]
MELLSHIEDRLAGEAARSGVLVAWSGGLDSTVLVDLVERWARRTGCEAAAVHVDHALRPSSAADVAFCERLAHERGVTLVVERLDIRRKGSLQQSARLQRYAAIARIARRLGLGAVLTAHHADDAVETALLNLRRGSSAGGLSSLLSHTSAPIPSWPDLALVRPLTDITKTQLRDYARSRGITWRRDPTNAEAGYARNLLRKQVVPALSDHGRLTGPICDTLANLAAEHQALSTIAHEHLERALLCAPDADSVVLRTRELSRRPRAVIARVLESAARGLSQTVGLGREHLTDAVESIRRGETTRISAKGALISIERGLVFIEAARGRGGRYLSERTAEPVVLDLEREAGRTPWFGGRLKWRRLAPGDNIPSERPPESAFSVYVDLRPADTRLVLRGPQPGDRLDAAAMQGTKTAAAVLAEAAVPRSFRWRWPCVWRASDSGEELVWLCGLRRAEPLDRSGSPAQQVGLEWQVDPHSVFAHLTHCYSSG